MTYKEIMEQLESIRDHSKDMARGKDADEIWQKDVEALDEAIDIIADYEKAAAQTAELIERYEKPEMAIKRQAGIYTCPFCGKRTQVGHTHCHWCGKKLTWDRRTYANRDCPYMKKGGRRR